MGAKESTPTEKKTQVIEYSKPIIEDPRDNYFKEDPSKIFENNGILIDNDFYNYLNRTGLSTTYKINGEIFLAWSGPEIPDKNKQTIHIYNLLKGKKETIIEGIEFSERSHFFPHFTVLSTYPQYARVEDKKWLYSADEGGFLRIFDISNNLKEVQGIDLNKDHFSKCQIIISAVIFDDKFHEIIKDPKSDTTLVAIYSANDFVTGAFIYNLKGESLLELKNEDKGFLEKMNFYYDEVNCKTCFFLGWSKNALKKYDFGSNNYTIQYPTSEKVVCLDFVFEGTKEKPEIFMVFAVYQSNILNICSVDKENIIKTVVFEEGDFIWDLCIWNTKGAIVSVYRRFDWRENYNYVVDLNNFEFKHFICSGEKNKECAENLIKVDINGKEAIVTLHREREVYLFK